MSKNDDVKRPASHPSARRPLGTRALGRCFEAASQGAQAMDGRSHGLAAKRVELHLVCAFCAMRQGIIASAMRELDAADQAAATLPLMRADASGRRVARRARLLSGTLFGRQRHRRSSGPAAGARAATCAYAAFALRIRIAILLARTDYESVAALAERAIALAEASGDDYVIVQVLNVLGAVAFDRATSKLRGAARARPSVIARSARRRADGSRCARGAALVRARPRRRRARALRVRRVVRGRQHRAARDPAGPRGPRRARDPQAPRRAAGARREVRRDRHAIESRVGIAHARTPSRGAARARRRSRLARDTGTFNVLLEFLEYDRSIVLDALGDAPRRARAIGAICSWWAPPIETPRPGRRLPGAAEASARALLSQARRSVRPRAHRRAVHRRAAGEPLRRELEDAGESVRRLSAARRSRTCATCASITRAAP